MDIRRILIVAATGILANGVVMSPVVSPVLAAPGAASPTASSLAWAPCDDVALKGFECATYDVPRDWNDPAAGVFTLAVARHRSSGTAKERIGSLFFNPGGPGGSGLAVLPSVWKFTPAEVRQRFDIVSWDPRGIGASTPAVECEMPEWALPPATGEVDWISFAANVRELTRKANEECLGRYTDVAPYVGTNNVVRDLDALRAAVGDQRLTYWGASYGTRIGYVYALTYPDHFRAILLDGPVSPRSSIEDFTVGYSSAADPALGMLFERYPQTKSQYVRALAALKETPLKISATRTMTQWQLGYGLEGNAGSQANLPLVAKWLGQVDKALFGSATEKRIAKRFLRSLPGPVAASMSGLPAFVNCLDYSDRLSAAEQDAAGATIRGNAPITGWYRAQQIAPACQGLQELTPDPVPLADTANWTAKMLILGATRDSQTPYKWTTVMANAFKASPVITYVGNQHVTYGIAASTCINNAVGRYFIRLQLPPVDTACNNIPPA